MNTCSIIRSSRPAGLFSLGLLKRDTPYSARRGPRRRAQTWRDLFIAPCALRKAQADGGFERLATAFTNNPGWRLSRMSVCPACSARFRIAFGFTDALFFRTMISAESVTTFIRQMFPDAQVTVIDKTGTQDHLIVRITSDGFVDKNLLDRHRMVYQALAVPMKDGRIHALEISATTKAEAEQ